MTETAVGGAGWAPVPHRLARLAHPMVPWGESDLSRELPPWVQQKQPVSQSLCPETGMA